MENVEYKEVEEIQEIEEEKKMPVFLKVLCILSFIYIGIILIPSIFGLFSGPMSETELNETFQNVSSLVPNSISKKEKARLLELAYEKQKVMNDKFYLNATINIWVYSLGFFGVFKMFKKRQRSGYYLYLVYSALSVFSLYLILPTKLISMEDVLALLLWSGIMVSLYTINLKHLTN
jgi:hypothetical protein